MAAKEIEKDPTSRSSVREIENANKQKQLNHDNIVKILDTCNEEDDVWLFLELCDGGDLNTFAREHFQEFNRTKFSIMTDVARGLHFLHELRIAHRDIKPENVLIDTKNGKQQVKLTDFGLSKFHPRNSPTSAMHTNIGTHTYKAPDFWSVAEDGSVTYHKNVDVYALGLTYLGMLQAKEGENLRPLAEGCLPEEEKTPIGLVMHTRITNHKPELEVLIVIRKRAHEGDSSETSAGKKIKTTGKQEQVMKPLEPRKYRYSKTADVRYIIRRATSVRPRDRPTAERILDILENGRTFII